MTAKRRTKDYIPVTVPFRSKPSSQTASRAGEPKAKPTREVSSWANRHVWTNRMLDALTVGVRGGRWHALIDKVISDMNLYVSACKVVGKKGSAGVDRQSTEDFSASQMAEIKQLQEQLCSGTYRPQAVRRVRIPKPGSNQTRPLGIPTVRDRVVQTALVHVIEPIFDNEFHDRSFGFRHGLSCHDALQVVEELLEDGHVYVVDADLQSYFDTIPKDRLMQLIEAKISDRRLLGLIRSFLDQSILEELQEWTPDAGVPQGAVLSPLLSNLYLNELDHRMAELGYGKTARTVRREGSLAQPDLPTPIFERPRFRPMLLGRMVVLRLELICGVRLRAGDVAGFPRRDFSVVVRLELIDGVSVRLDLICGVKVLGAVVIGLPILDRSVELLRPGLRRGVVRDVGAARRLESGLPVTGSRVDELRLLLGPAGGARKLRPVLGRKELLRSLLDGLVPDPIVLD